MLFCNMQFPKDRTISNLFFNADHIRRYTLDQDVVTVPKGEGAKVSAKCMSGVGNLGQAWLELEV